jgi:hypothetical protein
MLCNSNDLKQIKGRWACLFLDFRFYLPLKTIQAKKETATIRGTVVPFQTKMTFAAEYFLAYFSDNGIIQYKQDASTCFRRRD